MVSESIATFSPGETFVLTRILMPLSSVASLRPLDWPFMYGSHSATVAMTVGWSITATRRPSTSWPR